MYFFTVLYKSAKTGSCYYDQVLWVLSSKCARQELVLCCEGAELQRSIQRLSLVTNYYVHWSIVLDGDGIQTTTCLHPGVLADFFSFEDFCTTARFS
jgi:hypothetical protein